MILEHAVLPMTYRVYIFDLYGTLVDISTDEDADGLWEKLVLFMGYYGAEYSPEELRADYHALVHEKEKNLRNRQRINRGDVHESSPEIEIRDVFRDLYRKKEVQAEEALVIHTGQFFRVLSTNRLKLYPGTKEMLHSLRMNGKKIYLLSNAQRIFTEYEMRYLGLTECFDGIRISSDYGTKKPDPEFFNGMIRDYSIDRTHSLFIGNDSVCDIAGARKAGLSAFYVKSSISPEGDSAPDADYIVDPFEQWETISPA